MIRWINGNRGGDNYRQHKYEKSQHRELIMKSWKLFLETRVCIYVYTYAIFFKK